MKRKVKLIICAVIMALCILGILLVGLNCKNETVSFNVSNKIYMTDIGDQLIEIEETKDSGPTKETETSNDKEEKIETETGKGESVIIKKEDNSKTEPPKVKKSEEDIPLTTIVDEPSIKGEDNELEESNETNENNNNIGLQQIETNDNIKVETTEIKLTCKIIIYVLSFIFSMVVSYLLLSKLCTINPFIQKENIWYLFIISIVLSVGISFLSIFLINYNRAGTINGEKVFLNDIDLSKYNSDIEISTKGEYTLYGNLNHSIIVNCKNDVTLNLKGVNIASTNNSALYSTQGKLIINTIEGTNNVLSDGGESEYDGALYSTSDLIINGKGSLVVNGNQKDGEGISTKNSNITINSGNISINSIDDGINAGGDNGGTITINGGDIIIDALGDGIDSNDNIVINDGKLFVMSSEKGDNAAIDSNNGITINGGHILALGSGELERPLGTSTQKSLTIELDETIPNNQATSIQLNNKEIISFISTKSFSTIIYSTKDIENKEYSILSKIQNKGMIYNGIYVDKNSTGGSKVNIKNQLVIE